MVLSTLEYNTLQKITSLTHADDWFWLTTDALLDDIVVDLETKELIPWHEAMCDLNDTIDDWTLEQLTPEEKHAYYDLYHRIVEMGG